MESPYARAARVCSSFTGDRFRDLAVLSLIGSLVGCSVCYFLALPLKFSIRWNILWSNSPLGYEIETLACLEDTFVCGWSHPSRLCDANGRNPERSQLDHEQHRWAGVQLVGRYAGSTPGMLYNIRLFRLS